MSQYFLVPHDNKRFSLTPVEENISFEKDSIEINLPHLLFKQTKTTIKVKNKKRLLDILRKINRSNIKRNKNGLIEENGKIIPISFDDAVISICNKKFSHRYEKFYALLRKKGITF